MLPLQSYSYLLIIIAFNGMYLMLRNKYVTYLPPVGDTLTHANTRHWVILVMVMMDKVITLLCSQ